MKIKKNGKWLELVIPKDWEGLTIEEVLKEKWKSPKKLTHQFRMDKSIQINDAIVTDWKLQLRQEDRFKIRLFVDEDYGVAPVAIPISIVYEDDHLLIANKPARMNTHPSGSEENTLSNAVAHHLQLNQVKTKIRHIHRLDQDTTGGVIFAKHPLSGAILDEMLARRNITRTYVAFAHGLMSPEKGTIQAEIGRDRHHPLRRRVSKTGDDAITHYEVLEVFPKSKLSLVRLQLDTGRTHQIRVHLSHLGYPIIGDVLYGGRTMGINRQALHAEHICFIHPFTFEEISVKIPWPNDLNELFKKVKG